MKTLTINLYQFSELSDEAKEKAISNLSDINVDFDWWTNTYEDAARIGLKITSFDLDRNCVLFGPNGSGKTRILKTLVEISDFKLRVDSLPEILSKYNIEKLKIDNYNLNSESDIAIINIEKSMYL